MKRKAPLYLQVYNTILSRIYEGDYEMGSLLPPISKLSEELGVSAITIRCAYKRLCEEGFLQVVQGRGATVVYDGLTLQAATGADSTAKGRMDWIIERKNSIVDLMRMHEMLVPVLGAVSVHQADDSLSGRLQAIREKTALEGTDIRMISAALQDFMRCLFTPIRSELIDSLFTAADDFVRIPVLMLYDAHMNFYTMRERSLQFMDRVVGFAQSRDGAAFHAYLQDAYNGRFKRFLEFLPPSVDGGSGAGMDPGFHWSFLPENDFLYGSISNDLIIRIACGDYQNGTMLPARGAMCQLYHASAVTINSVVSHLNQLGIVRTKARVGTLVTFSKPGQRDREEILRLLPLSAKGAQILQFFAIMLPVFWKTSEGYFDEAAARLTITRLDLLLDAPESWLITSALPLLDYFVSSFPLPAFRSVLRQLEAYCAQIAHMRGYHTDISPAFFDEMRNGVFQARNSLVRRDMDGLLKDVQALLRLKFRRILEINAYYGLDIPLVFPELNPIHYDK